MLRRKIRRCAYVSLINFVGISRLSSPLAVTHHLNGFRSGLVRRTPSDFPEPSLVLLTLLGEHQQFLLQVLQSLLYCLLTAISFFVSCL